MKSGNLIRSRFAVAAASCICLSIIVGCGGDDGASTEASLSVEEQAAVASQAELKSLLQSVAASGEGGSALAGVGSSIEGLSLNDADKQKLLKDYEELNAATDPDKIKTIATRMASKL